MSKSFSMIMLGGKDRLLTLCFPNQSEIVTAVGGSLQRVWVPGIQSSHPIDAGYEWKLSGKPWYGHREEGTQSRRLIADILQELGSHGWHLHSSPLLTKTDWEHDTLVFKAGAAIRRHIFPLACVSTDTLRIIDATETAQSAIVQAAATWPEGIQKSGAVSPGIFEIKFEGNPWSALADSSQIRARLLFAEMLAALDAVNYDMVAPISCTVGQGLRDSVRHDVDTWFFVSRTGE